MALKWVCLAVLTLQTVTSAFVVRGMRNLNASKPVIIVFVELLKLATCSLVLIYHEGVSKTCSRVHEHVIQENMTTAKMAIPALLYVIQNQMLFVALANLDPATYQLTYQLKILTTAAFSIILLQKRINAVQWGSLLLLTCGVILAQWRAAALDFSSDTCSPALGVVCILAASCTSGFAGVYFELMLKGTKRCSNVWIANIQLSLCSVVVGACNVIVTEREHITKYGIFNDFDYPIITSVIISWAIGGVNCSLVMKYADNILKVFATSISIILSAIIGIFFLREIDLSARFGGGLVFVVTATILYARESNKS